MKWLLLVVVSTATLTVAEIAQEETMNIPSATLS